MNGEINLLKLSQSVFELLLENLVFRLSFLSYYDHLFPNLKVVCIFDESHESLGIASGYESDSETYSDTTPLRLGARPSGGWPRASDMPFKPVFRLRNV